MSQRLRPSGQHPELPDPGGIVGLKDAAGAIREGCAFTEIGRNAAAAPKDFEDYWAFAAASGQMSSVRHANLRDAYERQSLTGAIRTGIVRYGGEPLRVTAGGETFHLERDAVVASIMYKPTALMQPETLAAVLADRRSGMGSRDLHERYGDAFPPTWNKVVGEKPAPGEASTGFLVLANGHPALRGIGLSGLAVAGALDAFADAGLPYAWAYARLPGLSEAYPGANRAGAGLFRPLESRIPVHDYVDAQMAEGAPTDWGLKFHVRAGAVVACAIPGAGSDELSYNYGALVVYDLAARSRGGIPKG